jgi:hypothetical protein
MNKTIKKEIYETLNDICHFLRINPRYVSESKYNVNDWVKCYTEIFTLCTKKEISDILRAN